MPPMTAVYLLSFPSFFQINCLTLAKKEKIEQNRMESWEIRLGIYSVIEHLSSMGKTLGSSPARREERREIDKERKGRQKESKKQGRGGKEREKEKGREI